MHASAPAHKRKAAKKWLEERDVPAPEWPGNSPDLNLIEKAWNHTKNKVQELHPSSIGELQEELKKLWVTMDRDYCLKLVDSMPE